MKRITVKLSDEVYDTFVQRARDQRRSPAAEIELQLEACAGFRSPLAAAVPVLPPAPTETQLAKPPKPEKAPKPPKPEKRSGRPSLPIPTLLFPVDWADRTDLEPAGNQLGLAGVYPAGQRFRARVLSAEGLTEFLGPFDTPVQAAQARRDYYKAYGLPPGSMATRRQLIENEKAKLRKLERDYTVGIQMGLTPEQIRESIFVTDAHIAMANAGIRFGTEPDDMLSQPVAVDMFSKYWARYQEGQQTLELEMARIRAERGLPPVEPEKTFADYPGLHGKQTGPQIANDNSAPRLTAAANDNSAVGSDDADDGEVDLPGEFDPSLFAED